MTDTGGHMGVFADHVRTEGTGGRLARRLLSREASLGYVLLVPTLLMLLVFLAWPFLYGLWLSLTNAELQDPGHFIGLSNFKFEFTVDRPFMEAFTNTFLYTGVTTVFKLGLGPTM